MGFPGRCARFERDLSSFADGTLPERRWHQVGYHVAGCDRCRDELEQLRRVCSLLHERRSTSTGAPASLTSRLQSIAGEAQDQPLYMSTGRTASIPSARTRRGRRFMQASVAAAAALCTIFAVAVLLAPEPPTVENAVAEARQDYSLSVTAINVNESLGAVLLARATGAVPTRSQPAKPRTTMLTTSQPLTEQQVAEIVHPEQANDLTFSGTKRVWITDNQGRYHVNDVRVEQVAGTGMDLSVMDSAGEEFSSWFVPSVEPDFYTVPQSWQFRMLDGMDQVAGRWAHVVDAYDGDLRVARWWLDSVSGQILWSERYDAFGAPTIMTGFIDYNLGQAAVAESASRTLLMNRVTRPVTDTGWCHGMPQCPETLAGLPLVGHTSNASHGVTSMRLIYSDGYRNISVQWSDGILADSDSVQDSQQGLPDVAAWQADDGVVTVATNGGLELLHDARAELPGQEDYDPSLWDRAAAGFGRMLGIHS